MHPGSDSPRSKCVWFRSDLIPQATKEHHNLESLKAHDGCVHAEVNKAWCRLKQAGKTAHDDSVKQLEDHGHQKTIIKGCFQHETRNISFALAVDDFLVKCAEEEDLQHISDVMGKHHTFKVDLDAKQHVGIHLKWDCKLRAV